MENTSNAAVAFEKCTELDAWLYLFEVCKFDNSTDFTKLGIINKFDKFMLKGNRNKFIILSFK